MSERLRQLVSAELDRLGDHAKEKLALAANVSSSTVENARTGRNFVSSENVYRLALACGATDDEATALMKQRIALGPKRTAS